MLLFYLDTQGKLRSQQVVTSFQPTEQIFVVALVVDGVRSSFTCANSSLTDAETLWIASPTYDPQGIMLDDFGAAGRVITPINVKPMFTSPTI